MNKHYWNRWSKTLEQDFYVAKNGKNPLSKEKRAIIKGRIEETQKELTSILNSLF